MVAAVIARLDTLSGGEGEVGDPGAVHEAGGSFPRELQRERLLVRKVPIAAALECEGVGAGVTWRPCGASVDGPEMKPALSSPVIEVTVEAVVFVTVT